MRDKEGFYMSSIEEKIRAQRKALGMSLQEVGDQIGVTMGQTLNNVVVTNKVYDKFKNIMFVPMEGGISQSTVDGADVQGNEIARKFADKFGGTYTQFLSPAVFSDKVVLDYFMQEKAVNYILDEFKKINVAVLAMGIPEKADHTLLKAGYATNREWVFRRKRTTHF